MLNPEYNQLEKTIQQSIANGCIIQTINHNIGGGDNLKIDYDATKTFVDSVKFAPGKIIVCGAEGDLDNYPGLKRGDHLGSKTEPELYLYWDGIDGTSLVSIGEVGAVGLAACAMHPLARLPDFKALYWMGGLEVNFSFDEIDFLRTIKSNLKQLTCNNKSKSIFFSRIKDETHLALSRYIKNELNLQCAIPKIKTIEMPIGLECCLAPNSHYAGMFGISSGLIEVAMLSIMANLLGHKVLFRPVSPSVLKLFEKLPAPDNEDELGKRLEGLFSLTGGEIQLLGEENNRWFNSFEFDLDASVIIVSVTGVPSLNLQPVRFDKERKKYVAEALIVERNNVRKELFSYKNLET